MRTIRMEAPDYVITPYTVIVDSREQHPFGFTGYTADSRQRSKPLLVSVEVGALKTGDYSLKGYEDRVAVERKSLQDAYGTFSQDRERWERELERLAALDFAAVVVEAGWGSALTNQPFTRFSFKSFYRSVIAWQVRYRTIQWLFADTRSFAERTTLRWLERFWLDEQDRIKKAS